MVWGDPDNTFEKTGTDLAKYIARKIDVSKAKKDLKIICHSMNPKGRKKMTELLRKAGFDATDIAFDELRSHFSCDKSIYRGNVLDRL